MDPSDKIVTASFVETGSFQLAAGSLVVGLKEVVWPTLRKTLDGGGEE